MTVVNSDLTARMNPHKLLGRRWEGQHAEAEGITPSEGDEFWAWDTGYVLRDNGEGSWEIWFRTLPVHDVGSRMTRASTWYTESF